MSLSDPHLDDALRAYSDNPLGAGDAVLFLDGRLAVEVAGLADQWDEVLRHNTCHVLRQTAREVVLAIARPGADLLPGDYRIWREMHEELRSSAVDLRPVKALPAA